MAGLVERDEQEDVAGPLHESGIPDRGRELEAEERRDLFARVAPPELQLAAAPAERRQMPFGPFQLQAPPRAVFPARQRPAQTSFAGSSGS